MMGIKRVCLLVVCLFISLGVQAEEAVLSLSSNLAAEVVEVRVSAGKKVKRGALMLQLENDVARVRLQQARTERAHQELLLKEADNELQRSEELYDRTLLADHDLDLARIAQAAAQSSYQGAVLRVKEAEREMERRRIVAPFDAQVLEVFVQVGETINGTLNSVKLITLSPL